MNADNEAGQWSRYRINPPIEEYEKVRYSDPRNILRSEQIYGEGFQSPGGLHGFKATLLDEIHQPLDGKCVLDIGSGLGGAAFYLVERYGARVTGIDVSNIMVEIAQSRQKEKGLLSHLKFIQGDVFSPDLLGHTFDIIYSKDVLLYDHNKAKTFQRCHDLLVDNGVLCISDFCRDRVDEDFEKYMRVSNYDLITINEYAHAISSAGFKLETIQDVSDLALKYLRSDLATYQSRLSSGNLDTNSFDAEHIVERWQRKINYLEQSKLTQGLFVAAKC